MLRTVTCRRAAAEGRGGSDGWGDWGGEVSIGMARWRGNTAARQIACQRKRQLGLHLLLQGIVFSPCSICHEPGALWDISLVRVCMILFMKRDFTSFSGLPCLESSSFKSLLPQNTCSEKSITGSIPIEKNTSTRVYDGQ